MIRDLFLLITGALILGEALLAAPEPEATMRTEALRPFTHFAQLPAGADPASIRFEKIKTVKIPIRVKHIVDARYCQSLAFRDPGGSMYCDKSQTDATAAAFEVTYSFAGQPLASDEYGDRRSTFQVYFRPDEIAPELGTALSGAKGKRAHVGEYFTLNTFADRVQTVTVDVAESKFCAGNFIEGNWTHSDPKCKESIIYKTATSLSGNMTVRVDPMTSQSLAATASARAR